MILDYDHTYHNAKICYYASDMILHVKSNAAYLVMTWYHSLKAGNYYLSNNHNKPTNPSYVKPNRPILTKCKTLRYAFGSAE